MSGAALPPVIPEPFASFADPGSITIIPDTTSTAGRASYHIGFPPLTMTPIAGGGVPPFGQDVNGILFAATAHNFYVQSGQLFLYNSAVASSLGGYAVGTILGSTDLKTVWFNTTDANFSNPDNNSAAGWVSLFSTGFQPFTGLTGGTLTLTPTQAARKVITLSGTLIANQAVVLPAWVAPAGRWLIVNNTTGAFTLTVRTAGGTGVAIPQGGLSFPVEVYGDGTNIYSVTPASALIPVSQSGTPLTLVQRTNNSEILAQWFVSSAAVGTPPVTNVFVDSGSGSGSGYIQKIALANFEAALTLSAQGGQVTAGQVPLSAVIQYVTNILASAALTGTPTAPTAASGTSTAQVATCQFANPSSATTMPGFFKLPSGHIVQYGTANPGGGGQAITLTVPYSGASNYVILAISVAGSSVQTWVDGATITSGGFTLHNTGGSAFWATIGF